MPKHKSHRGKKKKSKKNLKSNRIHICNGGRRSHNCSDAKPKGSWLIPIESREKSKLKLYIYLQWRGEKQKYFRFSHDENAITRRVMKFDHSLRFLGFRKNWKPVVDQPKPKKSPSEKFSDQIKEEKQTNPSKGAS